MDGDAAEMAPGADKRRPHSAPGAPTPRSMATNGSLENGASNASFGDVLGALGAEMSAPFTKLPAAPFGDATVPRAAPAAGEEPVALLVHDPALSDSAFAASMASFTSDLHAELARLSAAPVASLYFDQPTTTTTTTTSTTAPRHSQCAGCSAALDDSYAEAYAATGATFCLCCERPLPLPGMDYVQEEDAAFPRCAPCLLARLPAKPVVDEPWWPAQYKHALLRAVEAKLWRKLLEVGNLPQGGASARHQLYHRRNQLENAQRAHERKTLEAARSGSDHGALFREWHELLVREDAENFRLIVLLSKCLQEIGRGVPPEVGEALQLCRGRDLRGEHEAARRVASVLTPVSCCCCPAVLSIPPPSGVPLPNPCFCFCCARMVPESLMYQPENASKPTSGDLCLDCAAAHDDLERKWFLVSASPTMVDWKRHKVAMGLERQLKRVRDSTAAAYKAGCESEKDKARWRVADDAAAQWQSRTEKILSEQRGVLRRGWTPVADSRQSYSIQVEYETKVVVAIPPLLKVLANLLVRQRIAVGGDDVRTTLKRSESMDEPRSEGRDIKVRKC